MAKSELSLVLVMPPQAGLLGGFATGLISIANFVQANVPKVEVQLLDLSNATLSGLEGAILQGGVSFAKNTVVGITATTASHQTALAAASAFKRLLVSDVQFTTVLGGPHPSADAEILLRSHPDTVDYVVIGEGEIAMTEFLRRFPHVCSTPGLAFLHKGSAHVNAPPPLLNERQLDSIPLMFKKNGLKGTPGKFDHVTYVSARGCPLNCAFCSVANQKIRARSVVQVAKDIRQLVELGFTRIAIEDNFFAHTPRRTDELCGALAELRRKGLKFTWDCQTRVESMDREGLVRLMERAGCEAVYLGVESLNLDQLDYLDKAPNPSRYLDRLRRKVVPALLESDVACYINLQFGLPGETEAHHAVTKNILKEMGLAAAQRKKEITIFPQLHVVYPGTSHFDSGWRQKKFPRDIFESFTAWEAKQAPVLNWLGKHFAHGTGGIPIGILNPEVLRTGRFEVETRQIVKSNAVMRIDSILTDLDDLEGIRVFKYGSHLVPSEETVETPLIAEIANS
ncbi:MAG: cobalamin-dependent protein [Verrucomicrobiota bacterium]